MSVLYCQAGLREPCSAENILPPLEVSGVQIGSPSTTIHDSSTGLEGFGPWLGAATPGDRRRPYVKRKGYRVISAYLFRSCCHGRVSVPVSNQSTQGTALIPTRQRQLQVLLREGGQGQLSYCNSESACCSMYRGESEENRVSRLPSRRQEKA